MSESVKNFWNVVVEKARLSRWISIGGGFALTGYLAKISQLNETSAMLVTIIVLAGIGGEAFIEKIRKPSLGEKALEKLVEKA